MQSEVIRFRQDVAKDPSMVRSLFRTDLSIDDLTAGANRIGYDFTVDDAQALYSAERAKKPDWTKVNCYYTDESGGFRSLRVEEYELVGGGAAVYVAPAVYIAVGAYTVAVVGTFAGVFAAVAAVVNEVTFTA